MQTRGLGSPIISNTEGGMGACKNQNISLNSYDVSFGEDQDHWVNLGFCTLYILLELLTAFTFYNEFSLQLVQLAGHQPKD